MARSKTADESSKANIANSVITEKKRYFLPAHDAVIEANSPEEAGKIAKARASKKKAKNIEKAAQPEAEGDE